MTEIYSKSAQVAVNALKRFGQSIPITRTEKGAYDPVSDSTTDTVTNGNLTAIVSPVSKSSGTAFDDRFMDRSLVGESVRVVICAAADAPFEPKAGDKVTFESADWSVLGVTPISPAGVPIVYRLGVKK